MGVCVGLCEWTVFWCLFSMYAIDGQNITDFLKITIEPEVVLPGATVNITCMFTKEYANSIPDDRVVVSRNFNKTFDNVVYNGNGSMVVTLYNVTRKRDAKRYLCQMTNHYGTTRAANHELQVAEFLDMSKTKVNCFIRDFQVTNCSWNVINYGIFTKWTIFKITIQTIFECPLYKSVPRSRYGNNTCEWNKDYTILEGINITLVATNALETDNSTWYFPSKEIYYISPVINVGTSCMSTSCLVTWGIVHNPNYPNIDLESNIHASSKWNRSPLLFFKTLKLTSTLTQKIFGLVPNTLYTLSISVKTNTSILWSNPTMTTIITLANVPGGSPDVVPGSFTQYSLNGNEREIILYWKELDMIKRHGRIEYSLMRDDANGSRNTTNLYMSYRLRTNESYRFQLRAINNNGSSRDVSHISIPHSIDLPATPTHLSAELRDSNVNLAWQLSAPANSVVNVTIHYCKGDVIKPDKVVAKCHRHYNFVVLRDYKNRDYLLNATVDKSGYRFGVSVERGGKSSGIQWTGCLYRHESVAGKPDRPKLIPLVPSGLSVSWTEMDCATAQGIITHYIISYFKKTSGKTCEQGETVEVFSPKHVHNITSLNSNTPYNVCLRAVTHAGKGPWSDISSALTNYPETLGLASVAGIITGFMASILFLIVLYKCYRRKPPKLPLNLPPHIDNMEYVDIYTEIFEAEVYDRPPVDTRNMVTAPLVEKGNQYGDELPRAENIRMEEMKAAKIYHADSGNGTASIVSGSSELYPRHNNNGYLRHRDTRDADQSALLITPTALSNISDQSSASSVDRCVPEANENEGAPSMGWSSCQEQDSAFIDTDEPKTLDGAYVMVGEPCDVGAYVRTFEGTAPKVESVSDSGLQPSTPVSPYCLFSTDNTPNFSGEPTSHDPSGSYKFSIQSNPALDYVPIPSMPMSH